MFDISDPLVLIIWLIIDLSASWFAADYAKKKTIGFNAIFIISIFATPIIGFLIAFASPEIERNDIETSPHNIADELQKLAELKTSGILTDEEFQIQKKKLIG